jgi:integrase
MAETIATASAESRIAQLLLDGLRQKFHQRQPPRHPAHAAVKPPRQFIQAVRPADSQMFPSPVENQARKLAMPPTPKPCGRFLAMEELGALLVQLEFRDRLIVRMFCTMGFRPGELFAFWWDDIEAGRARVDESVSRWGVKEPKTDGSDAYLPMPAGIQSDMDLWRGMRSTASPASLVFPGVMGTAIAAHNYERDVIVPAAICAGIMAAPPKERKKGDPKRDKATAVNFQAFRRTFATWMQRTGATVRDVQGAMRHSSPDQTLKAYMRELPDSVRTAVDALDRMFTDHGQALIGSNPNLDTRARTAALCAPL